VKSIPRPLLEKGFFLMIVPVYYGLADLANVSLFTGPVDIADECTMYQEIGIS